MELVLTLPILGLLLLGVLEFALLFFARGEVVEASRLGARLATMPGVQAAHVQEQVFASLSPRLRAGAEVLVKPGEFTGDAVVVGVRVPMAAAAPDLLWPVGFSLQNNHLVSETRMTKE